MLQGGVSASSVSRGSTTPVSSPALTRKSTSHSSPDESGADRLPTRSGSQIKRTATSEEAPVSEGLDSKKGSWSKRGNPYNSTEGPSTPVTSPLSMGNSSSSISPLPPAAGAGASSGTGAGSSAKKERKSNRFSTMRAKRSSSRVEDSEDSDAAFPGLSLRSSDAAAFLELLKSDKQRKEGADPEAEETRSHESRSPPSPDGNSPEVNPEIFFVVG